MRKILVVVLMLACGSAWAQWKSQDPYGEIKRRLNELNVRVTWTIDLEVENKAKPADKFYDFSVIYACQSRHDTGNKPNTFNQTNQCLGVVKHFDVEALGIRPYITYLHVFENSRDGKMVIKGPGLEACWFKGTYFDGCPGLTYGWVDYEDGRRGLSAHGKAKIPHFAFRRGAHAVVVEALGRKALGIYVRSSF